jgi:hypothetical protein
MSAGSVEVAPVPSPQANVINTNTILSNKLATKNEKTPAADAKNILALSSPAGHPPGWPKSYYLRYL